MDQLNSGLYRAEVTATEAEPEAVVIMPGNLRDVTLMAKGGGAGAAGNKVQFTLGSLAEIKADTAVWFDVNGLADLDNAEYAADKYTEAGTQTATAYRVVYGDADSTLVVVAKPA